MQDPHSAANPAVAKAVHLDLTLDVDFDRRTLSGTALWTLDLPRGAGTATFDTRGLDITSVDVVTGKGKSRAKYRLGADAPILGAALNIEVPTGARAVSIRYKSSPNAAGLQWLEPSQTADRKLPFLYSQAQAILARTFVPCQDSPGIRVTYNATIRTPAGFEAVMSAIRDDEVTSLPDGRREFRFSQPHPIPSYLIAIAVGDLAQRELGPRTSVWAEPSVVEKAAFEFADLERMIDTIEGLYGPYAWNRYDVLVLPPSFPFGGMENPMMTFATPTLLAGDRSLVNVIVHELAHSWSGNLVTNETWNDFWLNEGFTVYLERRAVEALYGTSVARRQWTNARRALRGTCAAMSATPADTHLRLALAGRDPDDGMTEIAYEKGALLLRRLEFEFGRDVFDQFLKAWFATHAFGPVGTELFLAWVRERLCAGKSERFAALRLERWIDGPGIPDDAPPEDLGVLDHIESQVASFNATGALPSAEAWSTDEWLRFLDLIDPNVTRAQLTLLDEACGLTLRRNAEVVARWLEVGVKHELKSVYPRLESFLMEVGRRKYLKPLYGALALVSVSGLDLARHIYARSRPGYHAISRATLDKMLGFEGGGF